MKKVIYLDLDGVLRILGGTEAHVHPDGKVSKIWAWHKPCIDLLQDVVIVTEASVVLSSTMRHQHTAGEFAAELQALGYRKLADALVAGGTTPTSVYDRAEAILAHVAETSPERWVALDDYRLNTVSKALLIHPTFGLQPRDAINMLALLSDVLPQVVFASGDTAAIRRHAGIDGFASGVVARHGGVHNQRLGYNHCWMRYSARVAVERGCTPTQADSVAEAFGSGFRRGLSQEIALPARGVASIDNEGSVHA